MEPQARALIESAVRAGLLSRREADDCLDAAPADPVEWLIERKLVSRRDLEALSAPSAPPRIGPYTVGRVLGQGGMGAVYAARDPKSGRDVAVKVFRGILDPKAIERFRRESGLLASLRHPAIVSVLDAGEENGQPYFVMELIEGPTLETLPRREAIAAIRRVAEALEYAHGQGVLHRDVKPSNILVAKDGRAVLTDFGLARMIDESRVSVTSAGAGTPGYMSPEQARGDLAGVDERVDVWGLGATLYHALAGRPPFEGPNAMLTIRKILEEDPPPLSCEPDLRTICLKALEKDPQRRYRSAAEFGDELDRILNRERILARPPSTVRRWAGRRWTWLVAAGLAIAVVLVAAVAVFRHRSTGFRDSATEARAAFARRDWVGAIQHSDEALKIRDDPELRKIVEESRAQIARAMLVERLAPIEVRIRETRPYFYLKNVDIIEKLRGVEQDLESLEGILRDPSMAGLPDGWALLGLGRYFAGDPERAEKDLLRAESLGTKDPAVTFILARIYLERGFVSLFHAKEGTEERKERAATRWFDLARRRLEKAPVDWRGAREIDRDLVQVYLAMSTQDSPAVVNLCRQGLVKHGRVPGTEDFFCILGRLHDGEERRKYADEALAVCPQSAWAYYIRSAAHPRDQLDRMIDDLTTAIRIRPKFASAYAYRGWWKSRKRDYDGAAADLRKAMELDPENSYFFIIRGQSMMDRGLADAAIPDFLEAIRLDPEYADAHYLLGKARYQKKEYGPAIESLNAAIRFHPKDAAFYRWRAEAKRESGDLRGSIEDAARGLDLAPKEPSLWFVRGLSLMKNGALDDAIRDFDRAIELKPAWPEAFVNRGVARYEKKDFRGAVEDHTQALKLQPRYAPALYNRAVARGELGEFAGAIEDFTLALEARPNHPDSYFWRAMCRDKTGDRTGAVADLEAALRCASRNWRFRSEAETHLRMLRE